MTDDPRVEPLAKVIREQFERLHNDDRKHTLGGHKALYIARAALSHLDAAKDQPPERDEAYLWCDTCQSVIVRDYGASGCTTCHRQCDRWATEREITDYKARAAAIAPLREKLINEASKWETSCMAECARRKEAETERDKYKDLYLGVLQKIAHATGVPHEGELKTLEAFRKRAEVAEAKVNKIREVLDAND